MALPRVYEGTLDEIVARYGKQLDGLRLKVIVDEEALKGNNLHSLDIAEAQAKPLWQTAAPDEWIRALNAWGESHARNTTLLSDEAVERENIYEGRGD